MCDKQKCVAFKRAGFSPAFSRPDEPFCHRTGGLHTSVWVGVRRISKHGRPRVFPPNGQVEKQVQDLRRQLFTPRLEFDDLDGLNAWLLLRCNELGLKAHSEQKDQTIDALFERKPGALRDGAPFAKWQLPACMDKIKALYMDIKGGDRDFVELLMMAQKHGIEAVDMACDLALEQKTTRLPMIINRINQLVEPMTYTNRPKE